MFSELEELIQFVKNYYDQFCSKWLSDEKNNINLKKKTVADMNKNNAIYQSVIKFREFMLHEGASFSIELTLLFDNIKVLSRIKETNSITQKLRTYMNRPEQGRFPIAKCFNDIFGIRIILPYSFTHEELQQYIQKNHPSLKVIDSTKDSYRASHIYFKSTNNTMFQWELQVWRECDELDNFESHKIYKQEYTKWENNKEEGGM